MGYAGNRRIVSGASRVADAFGAPGFITTNTTGSQRTRRDRNTTGRSVRQFGAGYRPFGPKRDVRPARDRKVTKRAGFRCVRCDPVVFVVMSPPPSAAEREGDVRSVPVRVGDASAASPTPLPTSGEGASEPGASAWLMFRSTAHRRSGRQELVNHACLGCVWFRLPIVDRVLSGDVLSNAAQAVAEARREIRP